MFHNIDEAGLYSYFTPSPPTPTLMLTDEATETKLAQLNKRVAELEDRGAAVMQASRPAIAEWLKQAQSKSANELTGVLETSLSRDLLGHFTFDKLDGNKLANEIDKEKPAKLSGGNTLVNGQADKAVQFTGDDPVDLPIGNFGRHEPFSVSLWLNTPDEKERAVVFHRSRA